MHCDRQTDVVKLMTTHTVSYLRSALARVTYPSNYDDLFDLSMTHESPSQDPRLLVRSSRPALAPHLPAPGLQGRQVSPLVALRVSARMRNADY